MEAQTLFSTTRSEPNRMNDSSGVPLEVSGSAGAAGSVSNNFSIFKEGSWSKFRPWFLLFSVVF